MGRHIHPRLHSISPQSDGDEDQVAVEFQTERNLENIILDSVLEKWSPVQWHHRHLFFPLSQVPSHGV
jgi:hypothetical protein